MEKYNLVEKVAAELNLTKKDATKVIEAVFAAAADGLTEGAMVKVSGFGTFIVKTKAERKGINPKTKESIVVPATKVVTFKPAETLKTRVKG